MIEYAENTQSHEGFVGHFVVQYPRTQGVVGGVMSHLEAAAGKVLQEATTAA